MTANSNLYDKIVLKGKNQEPVKTKTYRGFSTISPDSKTFSLYDYALIKQDVINHFHIRQGERLENPTFGTIIWDVLFEQLTDELKVLIVKNVEEIINYDPRVIAENVRVSQYDTGLMIECNLTYLPYYITETLQMKFDEQNGLMTT